jgi:hypothetical protein
VVVYVLTAVFLKAAAVLAEMLDSASRKASARCSSSAAFYDLLREALLLIARLLGILVAVQVVVVVVAFPNDLEAALVGSAQVLVAVQVVAIFLSDLT